MSKHSRLTTIHSGIKRRCYNPNCRNFENYGGRGITVCDEWLNNEKISYGKHSHYVTKGFSAFKKWALSNGYKEGLSIDRIDNNQGYFPSNCHWVDSKIQNNNRRNNILITYKGKEQTLKQRCIELNLNYNKIFQRIHKLHWSTERALSN